MAARLSHRARKQQRLIESAGARVAGWSMTGSGHLRFIVVTPDGITHPLICASTPSDCRANRNLLARVRRWCRTAAANEPVFVG